TLTHHGTSVPRSPPATTYPADRHINRNSIPRSHPSSAYGDWPAAAPLHAFDAETRRRAQTNSVPAFLRVSAPLRQVHGGFALTRASAFRRTCAPAGRHRSAPTLNTENRVMPPPAVPALPY